MDEFETDPIEGERSLPLDFPCWFPIKAFGKDDDAFEELVAAIVRRHVTRPEENIISSRISRNGNFRAVTVRIMAENRAQLDRIYEALTEEPRILMLL